MIVSPFTLHYVCLNCRRSIKSVVRQPHVPCSICHGEMICLGRNFAAPRQCDDNGWKKVDWMIQNGWCGQSWPTQPKMTLAEAQESLAARKLQNAKNAQEWRQNQALEERRQSIRLRGRAAKRKFAQSKIGRRQLEDELKCQDEYQKAVLEAVANNSASSAPTEPTP